MTRETLERLKAGITTTSTAAFEAIERAFVELNEENGRVVTTANNRAEVAERALAVATTTIARLTERGVDIPQAPRVDSIETQTSTDFARQPTVPENLPTVRFLSKSSSLGGLANVRAYLNDLGVNAKRMRLAGSSYTPTAETLLVNWGGGFELPSNMEGFAGRHLNKLEAVKIAASKLKTFNKLKADEYLKSFIPRFTTVAQEASWPVVYAREELYGNSGDGIVVVRDGGTVPSAPLFVEGVNIKHEYRVHMVNGYSKIQKKARLGTENPNYDIRNLVGGWVFISEFTLGDRGRSELHDLSVKTLECLGLDFGAIDVVRTEENEWKILEVNTAPGISDTTNIKFYAEALISASA